MKRKWVLVTGQPGSGKTTAVKRLQESLAVEGVPCSGFFTEEVLDADGTRCGFDVVTIPGGKRGVLARSQGLTGMPRVGKYSVDVASFEALALPTLSRGEHVYILDEIGRMELLSAQFQQAVEALLALPTRLVGAMAAPMYGHRVPFCDQLACLDGVAVHKLTRTTRDGVVESLARELPTLMRKDIVRRPAAKSVVEDFLRRPAAKSAVEDIVRRPAAQGAGEEPLACHLELYFKNEAQLRWLISSVVLPLRAACALRGVILTFKGAEDGQFNPRSSRTLYEMLPSGTEIHAVWSAKVAFTGSADATYARFEDYVRQMAPFATSLLVVSGTGAKRSLDAVSTLTRAAASDFRTRYPQLKLGCAFNPHIGGTLHGAAQAERERETEFQRLKSKLSTGLVSFVWLQFGADAAALEANLARATQELKPGVRIIGSVFVPSESWLAKMRFRCWSGCYLGPPDGEYLGSLAGAIRATLKILQVYRRFGVEVVVESSVRTPTELSNCVEFLNKRDT